jgi:poly-beta-1,6 N-acetyl-D-glucosamine synthase
MNASWSDVLIQLCQDLLLLVGVPVLILGVLKLGYLPLAGLFSLRTATGRGTRRRTLCDDRPLVSVIVPAYNEAAVIINCIRSVLSTTYRNIEVILVDDGSTDDTANIIRELAQTDPRVSWMSQDNAGKGAALNRGIRHSAGSILMFVDADGIFSPGTIEEMLKGFDNPRVGAVCGDDRPVNLNRVQTRLLALISHLGTGVVRRALSVIGCLPIVSGNIGAFRRDVLEEIGYFREDTVGEDLELTWRVHAGGYRVVFRPQALVYAESPSTVRGLWKQRVRWARGLLQTTRLHASMVGNIRYRRFGVFLLVNTLSMIIVPALQTLALAALLVLLSLGRSPLGGDVLAVLGWLGLIVTVVLTLIAVAFNRAWADLRHLWTVPLLPLYSVLTGLCLVAALTAEARGVKANWNKLQRSGVISVPAVNTTGV